MEIVKIIKNIFDQTPQSIRPIETGLTNDNYIVELRDQRVVLRIPKPENQHLFDYHREEKVLNLMKNTHLDAPLLYYNADTGIKCNQYIEAATTYTDRYIKEAAGLIKAFHQCRLRINDAYDITSVFDLYCASTSRPLFDTRFAHHYLVEMVSLSDNLILCHNDLVPGNLLFTNDRNYLIDYEYAQDNDPYFDIMSFLTENDIQDEALRRIFYHTYFNHQPTEQQMHKLNVFEICHHVLWCQWATMMYNLHHDPAYKTIAELKYQRLKEKVA